MDNLISYQYKNKSLPSYFIYLFIYLFLKFLFVVDFVIH